MPATHTASGSTTPRTQPTLPIIGFLSHVQTDLAAQAKAAGFQQVMPRSQFTTQLPQILAMAKD